MMNEEFTIPVSRDDLLNKTGLNQYSVEEILPLRHITAAVQDFKSALRAQKSSVIVEHFDTLFSVLCLQKDVSPDVKEEVWHLVLKSTVLHCKEVQPILEGTEITMETRQQQLLITKMAAYLLCQFIELFEAEDTKASTTQITTAKGRGRKKPPSDSSMTISWEVEREKGVQALLQMIQLHIHRLWEPPIAEEEFVNMVTCCCYKLLENTHITRNKETRETINRVLAVMVKKYNHGLGASLKIIQLLQHFEHLVSPLAQAVEMFALEYGVKTVVAEIMREIGRIDSKDLARDSSGTRSYATFLVELSEKVPAVMLNSISVILGHLDGECYSMRNGVLGVMGEILVKVLSKDNLDSKQKDTRDQILDKLEDHLHDVHAFVRSKVLQIWLIIVNEKCLPLPRQENLANLVIGRLEDKSSQVRKHAIQLLTTLLKSNPFAAKLPLEELQLNYEKEKAKLEEMMPDVAATPIDNSLMEKTEQEWSTIAQNLEAYLNKSEANATTEPNNREDDESEDDDLIKDDVTPVRIAEQMCSLLWEGMFGQVLTLLQAGREAWPDHPYFTLPDKGQSEDKETEDDTINNYNKEVLDTLKIIFVDYKKSSLLSASDVVQSQEEASSQEENSLVNEVSKQQVLVQYLKDSMTFAAQVQTSLPIICQLLGSKTISDMLEAIEFFVAAYEFGVNNAVMGIRRMLVLVWSKESAVKDAIVTAYKRLYLTPQGGNCRAKALSIVKNLTALTYGATLGDITSLEELISEFYRNGEINGTVIQLLWERFTLKFPQTTAEESRAGLVLLSMIASAEMEIVKSNIDVLVKEGLGPRAETDFQLARDTCLVLIKMGSAKKLKGAVSKEPFRLPVNHDLFTRLGDILISGVSDLENQFWIPLAEQAVNVIYKLAEQPDTICSDIIKRLAGEVINASMAENSVLSPVAAVEASNNNEEEASPEMAPVDGSGDGTEGEAPVMSEIPSFPDPISCPTGILTRLLSMAGHVALRQLVYLDCDLFGELKRRHAIQDEKKEQLAKLKSASSTHNNTPGNTPIGRSKDMTTAEGIEEELGLTGAMAEDTEADYIRKTCESDIVTGQSLLAALRPLLVCVCTNQVKYPDPDLRTAASLALAKFMMVSSEFCDAHLQLLFTILEKSKNPIIRANTMIALGDLTFRFPNLIEPWTPHLYARLRDESTQVRKNTLQVLSHLILNDMVKVKGQISELATCIVDDNNNISGLSKLFFHELSKKGNAVYNIMPDVISRLSDPDIGVDEQAFRNIMRYLFSFIQKDKQCESLVEKLCHRFRPTRTERQWRDLSFCLSLLSYSEKALRKLQENFVCFADKLANDDVYNSFSSILSHAKKGFAKPETKTAVEELEQRLEQCHNKGLEEEQVADKANLASEAAADYKRGAKMPGKSRKGSGKGRTPVRAGKPGTRAGNRLTRNKRVMDDSDEDGNAEADEIETVEPRLQPKRGGRKQKPVVFDLDDSDLELFEMDQSNKDTENEVGEENKDNSHAETNISMDTPKSLKQSHAKSQISARRTRGHPLRSLNSPA